MKNKKYTTSIIAALIFVAAVIGYFIYTNLNTTPKEVTPLPEFIMTDNGINPGGGRFPDGPPSVPSPDAPPPKY